jgi:hypothetical protein
VDQTITSLGYVTSLGYINSNTTIVQSDTNATGLVITTNTSIITTFRNPTTNTFVTNLPIVSTTDAGSLSNGNVSILSDGAIGRAVIIFAGSGYSSSPGPLGIGNPPGASGAAATGIASGGRATSVTISNTGIGYFTEPTITVNPPANSAFNANTAVTGGTGGGANSTITIVTAVRFLANDKVTYRVAAGNTAISPLVSDQQYWIQFANTTHLALANSAGGARITLTKGLTETGHALQGETAVIRLIPNALLVTNATANVAFTSNYVNGAYIRVGPNANNNIRRIETVNSTAIIVTTPFSSTLSNVVHYRVLTTFIPTSVSTQSVNAVVTNTNLTSVNLLISNTSVSNATFTLGEFVSMVNANNVFQNANGIVSFANSTNIFLANVSGTWTSGFKVKGLSSTLQADISAVTLNPTINVTDINGQFKVGLPIFFSTNSSNTGTATLLNYTTIKSENIPYSIGPTVSVVGDGNGFKAYATVNTSPGSANTIGQIKILNPGSNYVTANVSLYALSLIHI